MPSRDRPFLDLKVIWLLDWKMVHPIIIIHMPDSWLQLVSRLRRPVSSVFVVGTSNTSRRVQGDTRALIRNGASSSFIMNSQAGGIPGTNEINIMKITVSTLTRGDLPCLRSPALHELRGEPREGKMCPPEGKALTDSTASSALGFEMLHEL